MTDPVPDVYSITVDKFPTGEPYYAFEHIVESGVMTWTAFPVLHLRPQHMLVFGIDCPDQPLYFSPYAEGSKGAEHAVGQGVLTLSYEQVREYSHIYYRSARHPDMRGLIVVGRE